MFCSDIEKRRRVRVPDARGAGGANNLDCRRTWRPVPRLLMRTVRNSALNNLRLNLSAARIFSRQFLPDSRGSGLLT